MHTMGTSHIMPRIFAFQKSSWRIDIIPRKKIAMVLIFMLSVVFGITVAVIVEFSKVMQFLKSMENSRWLPFYMAIYKFYNLLGYDDTDIAKAGFKLETRT